MERPKERPKDPENPRRASTVPDARIPAARKIITSAARVQVGRRYMEAWDVVVGIM